MYLAVVETRANQRYIFSSNKLAEAVGASALIARVGTVHLREAIRSAEVAPETVLDTQGRPLDTQMPAEGGAPLEVVVATSGVVQLLSEDAERLRKIVRHMTTAALVEAPGLDVRATIASFDWSPESFGASTSRAFASLARSAPPAPRFLRLPPVAECLSTGMPAAGSVRVGWRTADDGRREPEQELRSHDAVAKRVAAARSLAQLRRLAGEDVRLPRNVGELELAAPDGWLAVVHADVNGLGALFSGTSERTDVTNREAVTRLRRLSRTVAEITTEAARTALRAAAPAAPTSAAAEARHGSGRSARQLTPVLPLLLGGDDLLLVAEATVAFRFAVEYLRALEAASDPSNPRAAAIGAAQRDTGAPVRSLTAAAGIAVVKPHHPFAEAADLAHDLAGSAKQAGRERCRLDFLVAYGSTARSLSSLRGARPAGGAPRTREPVSWGGPYVVTGEGEAAAGPDIAWSHVEQQAGVLRRRVDGRPAIPRRQVQRLRDLLRSDAQAADAAFADLTARAAVESDDGATADSEGPAGSFQALAHPRSDGASLVDRNPRGNGPPSTMLLDVIAIDDVFGAEALA